MDPGWIIQRIESYRPYDSTEHGFHQQILKFISDEPDFCARSTKTGHITGSAWVTNVNYTHALLIHHKKLDRWLQPGGHVENDTNILETALREAKEETGINDFQIPLENIFDIDIHTIPAIKKEREHYHYDVRFLLVADEYSPITISHESNDLKWFSLAEISAMNEGPSIQRMVDKTLAKYAGIK